MGHTSTVVLNNWYKKDIVLNYIGSKLKLLNFIHTTIVDNVPDLKSKSFCDLFAGSGVVGSFFKPITKSVIANDLEFYSYVLSRHYLLNDTMDATVIDYLNNIPVKAGFIFEHYATTGIDDRQFFSAHNAQKIDAIRMEIWRMYSTGEISEDTYYFALASLLESADKVANTTSVYGAYLKKFKASALKDFILKPAKIYSSDNTLYNAVYNEDAGILIEKIAGDVLYLDPPYNHRQYGANYHLLNTIAKYDTDSFRPSGVTGLRPYIRSDYCRKKLALTALDDLIRKAKFTDIFLSYNDEGLIQPHEIAVVMRKYGEYSVAEKEHKRFKADKAGNRVYKTGVTVEHIHILKKGIK